MPTASSQGQVQIRHQPRLPGQAGQQIVGPGDPEHRRADQQVAQGAAADPCHGGEEPEGDDVVLAPRGGQGAGRAEHGDGGVVEHGQGEAKSIHGAAPSRAWVTGRKGPAISAP
jgi:hypothetical protein